MNDSTVNILNLCDEILLIIFNKLNKIDVLYALIGANRKLDSFARDTIFTGSVDLVTISLNEVNDSRNKTIFDRFCFDIVPRIHHNIESLTLDPLSIDRIDRIENYFKLHKLTLMNLQLEMASRIFNDESSFIHTFKHQISHLTVTIHDDSTGEHVQKLSTNVFTKIFIMFINLTYFHYHLQDICRHVPNSLINLPSTTCYS
ncbi:unnamed protein product [Rotaria socialis]|uniref:F-box domain-containing protein n=1 Tax=Rotaria socialis TaxID=392032 RepID=A0A821RTM4_9BILA|nr:unnamed protein product [Rotaria socialis]CAF4845811.1 unnamed protein product [Rotaria socialis]